MASFVIYLACKEPFFTCSNIGSFCYDDACDDNFEHDRAVPALAILELLRHDILSPHVALSLVKITVI
jgi:hypothetical protein